MNRHLVAHEIHRLEDEIEDLQQELVDERQGGSQRERWANKFITLLKDQKNERVRLLSFRVQQDAENPSGGTRH